MIKPSDRVAGYIHQRIAEVTWQVLSVCRQLDYLKKLQTNFYEILWRGLWPSLVDMY